MQASRSERMRMVAAASPTYLDLRAPFLNFRKGYSTLLAIAYTKDKQ